MVTGTNVWPWAGGLDIGTGRMPVDAYTCWLAGEGIIATPVGVRVCMRVRGKDVREGVGGGCV